MQLELSTPALLFPAITLLLLAYTNRFLAIASLIRGLHKRQADSHGENNVPIREQIKNLRLRLLLIRNMQAFGILSFLGCVLSILFLYLDNGQLGNYLFVASLVLLLVSLGLSFYETQISTKALSIELSTLEKDE
ncbi:MULTISPECIES: DUF2721 domain-containing protein [unclassified Imperialibacter]|uniref:DUF2721 domain-containing protein n=1 Tax=unclassified Imperialibacter TaxID=2629706 RepID=UPI00125889FB|nr:MULTISPECIES: DUF2721 domain-containing protein [unclassified Imperialibacter]CAD5257552.1 II family cellulose-binding protein [Imperialibacter sp. 75]CAD5260470.1 II family cellulose-binding protein [Imperialibacter sp. 89]VVT25511.1 II family cellulose-binding protein [Imperialibacter sp. EC-SDR9]